MYLKPLQYVQKYRIWQLSIIRYCDITVKPFLIRTPHCYGQFVLFLEKKSPCIFLKFQPLKTDAMLIWTLSMAPIMSILVSLLIRTAQRRRRQKPCVWQTWHTYYLRVCCHVQLIQLCFDLLQKDLLKGRWSLAEIIFKQNYCHACHTRFAVFFPLPSLRVGSLLTRFDCNPL